MTKKEAHAMSHSGDCRADVEYHLALPKFQRQFKKINPILIAEELEKYGMWDTEDLADTRRSQILILWVAAEYIVDYHLLGCGRKPIIR
ncbi:MAG: hypothetical protein E6Q97_02205 [Desulfurellales bacterium]|nr:MAG: hypothetical protein E6Q97_02205 [Desulfurellales bacterium]